MIYLLGFELFTRLLRIPNEKLTPGSEWNKVAKMLQRIRVIPKIRRNPKCDGIVLCNLLSLLSLCRAIHKE